MKTFVIDLVINVMIISIKLVPVIFITVIFEMEEVVVHHRTKNLKCTPTMDQALVDQVLAIGAYIKGGEENVEIKFKTLTVNLWKTTEFKNQGQPVSGASVQKRFKALL